jgi:mannose/fructose-specific phosphotransferase system component IIA
MGSVMRTGVVIVSHGDAGQAMLDAAQKIAGRIEALIVTVPFGEPRDVTARRVEQACGALSTEEVLFLVDLEGSTPFNVCQHRSSSVILSGINLPMLFKLATVDRARSALELAEELKATGQKSIHIRSAGADEVR